MMSLRFLVSPLALLFQTGVALRHILYDSGVLKKSRVRAKVISVGNLTSGGTGKTPFVALLTEWARGKKMKSAIVSLGYGVAKKGSLEVTLTDDAAAEFGDEPVELKMLFPDTPIFVGPSKSQTSLFVDQSLAPDLIIVDDGLQHLKLHRDFDLILVDATAPAYHYWPLPMGLARDNWARLTKASLIVVTKYNLATDDQKSWLQARLPKNGLIFYANYLLKDLVDLQTGMKVRVPDLFQKKVVLMSGLAHPVSFGTLMKSEKMNVVEDFQFPDHHAYKRKDIDQVLKFVNSTRANCIVTTQKDAVKLSGFIPFPVPVLVAQLKLELQNEKEFYEILDRHLT